MKLSFRLNYNRKGNIKPRRRNDIAFSLSRHQRHINQHVFGKDAVARCGIVDQHVGHNSHGLVVLNDGGALQECGQERTTVFNEKFTKGTTLFERCALVIRFAFNYS